MTSTATFISELVETAKEVDRLTKQECSRLLNQAATTLADIREIAGGEPPANDRNDAVHGLREMAKLVLLFKPAELATTLLNTAAVIKAAQMMIERRKVH